MQERLSWVEQSQIENTVGHWGEGGVRKPLKSYGLTDMAWDMLPYHGFMRPGAV